MIVHLLSYFSSFYFSKSILYFSRFQILSILHQKVANTGWTISVYKTDQLPCNSTKEHFYFYFYFLLRWVNFIFTLFSQTYKLAIKIPIEKFITLQRYQRYKFALRDFLLAEFNSILFNSIAVRLLLNYLARFAKPKFQKLTHPTQVYYTKTL